MNIVIAMDSLKGSLTSLQAGEAIGAAAARCGFCADVLPWRTAARALPTRWSPGSAAAGRAWR